MSDRAIFEDFANGPLGYWDAVNNLIREGHSSEDAERMVNEWIDVLGPAGDWPPACCWEQ